MTRPPIIAEKRTVPKHKGSTIPYRPELNQDHRAKLGELARWLGLQRENGATTAEALLDAIARGDVALTRRDDPQERLYHTQQNRTAGPAAA